MKIEITNRIALLVLLVSLSPQMHAAETVFIDDTLRVGVRTEPGNKTAPIAVITTGTKIERLKQQGSYSLVQTPNGHEGWVRSSYLSETPPAKVRLRTLEQELHQLQSRLQSSNADNQELNQKIKSLNDEIYQLHHEVAIFGPNDHRVWIVLLITVLVICGLTFMLGILWNKQQVAKKLGGHSL